MRETNAPNPPRKLGESMPAISPSAAASSESAPAPTRAERIERAVLAYLGDDCRPPRTQDSEALRHPGDVQFQGRADLQSRQRRAAAGPGPCPPIG